MNIQPSRLLDAITAKAFESYGPKNRSYSLSLGALSRIRGNPQNAPPSNWGGFDDG